MSCVLDSFDEFGEVVNLLGLVAGVTGSDATGSSNVREANIPSLAARESTTIPEDQDPCNIKLPPITHGSEQRLRCIFIWVRFLRKELLCSLTGCALSETAKTAVVAKFKSACKEAIIYVRGASRFFQSRAQRDNDQTRVNMEKVQQALAMVYDNIQYEFEKLLTKNKISTSRSIKPFRLLKIYANKVEVSQTRYVEVINQFETDLKGVITQVEHGTIKVGYHDDQPEKVEFRHKEKRGRGRPPKANKHESESEDEDEDEEDTSENDDCDGDDGEDDDPDYVPQSPTPKRAGMCANCIYVCLRGFNV